VFGAILLSACATHRILNVGPGEAFSQPSDAAAAVRTGDVVRIAPGIYVDCAVWPARARILTIDAAEPGVVIAGKVCEDKALFVIQSDDVTVRGITFTGANAGAHNGAGIRAEGRKLVVEGSRFIDNEEGILAGAVRGGTIAVRNSDFEGNGNCIAQCAHGIYVGRIAELRIERSRFHNQHIGHHIKSRAARTEVTDNVIQDGSDGTASYLVDIPDGGALILRGNTLGKGSRSDNRDFAVSLGEEGNFNPTPEIIIENNEFTSEIRQPTVFVRNLTATAAQLRGNRLIGEVKPLAGPGQEEGDVASAGPP
jgi:hypothetical protein